MSPRLLALALSAWSAVQPACASAQPPADSVCPAMTPNFGFEALLQQCLLPSFFSKSTQSKQLPASDVDALPIPLNLPPSPVNDIDTDPDPLPDNGDFLSFEDWKAQMLQKAGQSPEHVRGVRDEKKQPDSHQRPGSLSNALDALGDEGEIDLGLGGFGDGDGAASASKSAEEQKTEPERAAPEKEPKTKTTRAGTTSKERFNYASFDCAATVLKTNLKCKGPASVLVENKDTYMLNVCSEPNKFLIVELCNDILIDTIVLGNFEFFSSTFRAFRVSISDRYPVKTDKWKEIGAFEAQNTRAIQPFKVENGLIWARYLRIEFLSHYGSEYYCPVSLLRIHGKTMMDDYLNEVKASRGEDEGDDEEDEAVEQVGAAVPVTTSSSILARETPVPVRAPRPLVTLQGKYLCSRASYASPLIEQAHLLCQSCDPESTAKAFALQQESNPELSLQPIENIPDVRLKPSSGAPIEALAKATSSQKAAESINTIISATSASSKLSTAQTANVTAAAPAGPDKSNGTEASSASTNTTLTTSSKQKTEPATARARSSPSATNATTSMASRPVPAPPPPPAPTTQDSFFKSVHKRLLQLEANSSLSLQYIEEQSRLLRDALGRAERRQRARAGALAERWSRALRAELRIELRAQLAQEAAQLARDAVAAREQGRREREALAADLGAELRLLRRIAAAQAVALLLIGLGGVVYLRRGRSRDHSAGEVTSPPPVNGAAKPPAGHHYGRPSNGGIGATGRAAHLRADSSDSYGGRPSTPPSLLRVASRPGSRYGRRAPLRGWAGDWLPPSRPSSRGSGAGPGPVRSGERLGGDAALPDETGLQTPTASDAEGERPETTGGGGLSPDFGPRIRKTWSTPALGQLGDGFESGGE